MCNPALALLAVSTAVTAYSQVQNGKNQEKLANAQAQQTVNEGAYKEDAAKAQAEKIRKAGKAEVGAANAALAASGVKIGEGSALEIRKNIIENSEQDALSAILSGKRAVTAANDEAGMLQQSGANASSNGQMAAFGTVLSSAATSQSSGWKKAAGGGS